MPDPQPPAPPRLRVLHLLNLQALYGLFATLHWGLGYLFLFRQGLSTEEILAFAAVVYGVALGTMLFLGRVDALQGIRIGIVLRVLTIVPFVFWTGVPGAYAGAALFGAGMVLFWVPYNALFFQHRNAANRAGLSAYYFAVMPFIDMVATLAAGWLAVRIGFQAPFALALALGTLPLLYAWRMAPGAPVEFRLREQLRAIPKTRLLIALEGVSQGIFWPAVPLITVAFLPGPFQYAGFMAALGLAGVVASLVLARLSDRHARRMIFLYPFSFLFGITNLLSAFAGSVVSWGLWRGLASFSNELWNPFKNAVLLDQTEDVPGLYVAREFLLNWGRTAGALLLLGFHLLGQLQLALVVPGLIAFAYGVIIEAKQLYPSERLILKPRRTVTRQ